MDGQRFDDLTRLLGVSLHRKRFAALVAGLMGSAAVAGLGDAAAAKRRGRKRRRRRDGVDAQGNGGVCDAVCAGGSAPNAFCGNIGNCGSDQDCINQDPSRPFCCTNAACGGGPGEGACCSAPVCGGFCEKDDDCPDVDNCVCDESENRCVSVTCGGFCLKDSDCQDSPGCVCELPNNREVGGEGASGQCVTATCGGFCLKDDDCPTTDGSCICDEGSGQCVTITCTGVCFKDADCPELENCSCTINVEGEQAGAEGIIPGSCVSQACPGECSSNADCAEQGQGNCVCFLGNGVDVAAAVGAEGVDPIGSCGACHGAGASCDASTECCGHLVCQGGRCQRKRKPKKERCAKHGHACTQDPGCCAQAICYRGECGEKDAHCNSDNECARGYSCVGGRLTGGHRRCRRNRRKPPRNRRNRG